MSEQTVETPVLDLLARMTADSIEASSLDAETLILVRIAALVAVDAPPVSYAFNLEAAGDLEIDPEQVRGVLAAVAPIVGTARIASATTNIAQAFELELERGDRGRGLSRSGSSPPRSEGDDLLRLEGGEAKMSKKRGVLVWCLFGLATILLFVSSLTVWSKRQLLDDQAWADSSTQLLANDEVRGAIAQKLSDALFARVDVEAQLRERLPRGAGSRPSTCGDTRRTPSDPRPPTGSCSGRGCRPFGRTSTSAPTPVS